MKVIINVDEETGEADNFVWTEEEEPPPMVRPRIKLKEKENKMALSKNDIIARFLNYFQKYGGPLNKWYVGISQDAIKRLFDEHNVQPNDPHMFEIANNVEEAREIENYFIDSKRGMDGAAGGGDYLATSVYIYKKGPHTRP